MSQCGVYNANYFSWILLVLKEMLRAIATWFLVAIFVILFAIFSHDSNSLNK
jgi:hypothetical protein